MQGSESNPTWFSRISFYVRIGVVLAAFYLAAIQIADTFGWNLRFR